MTKTFKVTQIIEHEFEGGYGVYFAPVFTGEDEPNPDAIVDVDGGIMRIAPHTVREFGGALCVVEEDGKFGIPVENFQKLDDLWTDDTHDLRDRFFETEEEAKAHLEYTLERFANPAPWESFIQL